MDYTTALNRALRQVNDAGTNIYTDNTELNDAANDAIHDVKAIFDDNSDYYLVRSTITFNASDDQKDLPADFNGKILRLFKTVGDERTELRIIRVQDFHRSILQREEFRLHSLANGTWQIARFKTGIALTVNVEYSAQWTDITSTTDTTTLDFIPQTGQQLIVTKIALNLLSNRGRRNRRLEVKEQMQSAEFIENLQKMEVTDGEYVDVIGD